MVIGIYHIDISLHKLPEIFDTVDLDASIFVSSRGKMAPKLKFDFLEFFLRLEPRAYVLDTTVVGKIDKKVK